MLANKSQVSALIDLFHQGTKLTYRKGEYIIRPGETSSHVFYIEQGLVKAFDISKYGEENLLIIRKDREIFPLISAITGMERDIIYQTMGDVVVWRMGREEYVHALKSDANLLRPLLDMVTEMYRIHSERIINLEYRTVRERTISFLLSMANRFGKATEEGIRIEVSLRHQDIASSINATRETTSRELSRLEREGLIKNTQQSIIVTDIKRLQGILS